MMMTIKETFKSLIALKQQEITCVEMVPAKMKKRLTASLPLSGRLVTCPWYWEYH